MKRMLNEWKPKSLVAEQWDSGNTVGTAAAVDTADIVAVEEPGTSLGTKMSGKTSWHHFALAVPDSVEAVG